MKGRRAGWSCRLLRLGDQRDQMLAVAVDQGRHRPTRDHLDPAADQRETVLGKVGRGWRDADAGVEPGLHRMTVGRDDVDRARGKQTAAMAAGDRGGEAVI